MNDPRQDCKHPPETFRPLVNLSKCETKGPCVDVCPYQVLELRDITPAQQRELTFAGKIKTLVHGRKKAFVVYPEACHACGLCVTACPEKAIKLVRYDGGAVHQES